MIITQGMIFDMTCDESVAWFKAHPEYFGLTRKEFNRKLHQDEAAGLTPNNWWAGWADTNFFKSEAILHSGKLKRQGIYRTVAPGLTSQEFDNIDDAIAVLEAAKNSHVKSEEDYFHVQARVRQGPNGYEIVKICDTTLDTCDIAAGNEYFATFNMNTGTYEEFPTYGQAKNRMIELRNARVDLITNSYAIEEQIQEVGDPHAAPIDFVIVQTISGRKTKHNDRLDKIEKRPDPKPKKPKP